MKSVNILVAIRWVAQAWSIVSTQTISKCFRKAGILNSEMDIVSCSMEEDDPFSAVDVEADLTSLIHDVVPNCCSSDEYINGEDSLPVCNDLDSLTWEEDFMHQLGQVGGEEECDEDEEDDSEQLPISNVKTYKDAILALEDIKTFLESRGHLMESTKIGISVDSLASLQLAAMKQKTLHDFFPTTKPQ